VDKNYAVNAAKKFRAALEKTGIAVERLILFGSYADGTQREGSDIDIVVISGSFHGMAYWDRIDVLSRAIYDVFEPIEATAYTPEEWNAGDTTIFEYAKKGELIPAGN
jgi:uncharacterized protein